MGVQVGLPAGTYSDDTQLRLAVSRCIRAAGRFDVEAFSKIELPVFLSYGLGLGRGTRAAANSLSKRSSRWYSNFFKSQSADYVRGGGNGAAMRIQPHVWGAPGDNPEAFLPDVIRDTVATHGHIRGVLGAALHAVALGATLHEGSAPDPSRWSGIVDYLEVVPDILASDELLSERWLPQWERHAGTEFRSALEGGLGETLQLLTAAEKTAPGGSLESRYAELARNIDALDPASRGSGTVSAVLALWLAHHGQDNPASAIRCAANLFGSDTDTIASMTGALVGIRASDEFPGPLVDEPLIAAESERLARLVVNGGGESFPHPDPLHWQAPRTQADALGLLDGRPAVAGLGPAKLRGEPIPAPDGSYWQWIELAFGQQVLIKRREELHTLPSYTAPQPRLSVENGRTDQTRQMEQQQLVTDETPTTTPPVRTPTASTGKRARETDYPDDVEEGVALFVRSRYNVVLMANLLSHYANQPHGVTKAGIFGALVAKALRERDKRSS
jgi:ADP-ribosylglycohydrolase